MAREDYVIICGDFGGVWLSDTEEERKMDWLEGRSFTTLFIDGNHENFDQLNAFPVEEWRGEKVHKVRPHIFHLTASCSTVCFVYYKNRPQCNASSKLWWHLLLNRCF